MSPRSHMLTSVGSGGRWVLKSSSTIAVRWFAAEALYSLLTTVRVNCRRQALDDPILQSGVNHGVQ